MNRDPTLIDPDFGIPLTLLQPTPGPSFEDRFNFMPAPAPTPIKADRPKTEDEPKSKDLLSPETVTSLQRGADTETIRGGHKFGFFDALIFGLTGTPDAMLSPEKLKERRQRRAQVGNASAAASTGDAGESYMWAPGTGGSGFGLSDIIRVAASAAKMVGLGGGGGG